MKWTGQGSNSDELLRRSIENIRSGVSDDGIHIKRETSAMPHPQISKQPLHLGLGAKAIEQPEFDGEMSWYESYGARHGEDGAEGRLVMMHTFTESWDSWEVHPHGDEVVLCISGEITLHQELPDGTTQTVTLGDGEYAVNAPGVWHTADIEKSATVLFITAGMGTEGRPR